MALNTLQAIRLAEALAKRPLGASVVHRASKEEDTRWVRKLKVEECRDAILAVDSIVDLLTHMDPREVERIQTAIWACAVRVAEDHEACAR